MNATYSILTGYIGRDTTKQGSLWADGILSKTRLASVWELTRSANAHLDRPDVNPTLQIGMLANRDSNPVSTARRLPGCPGYNGAQRAILTAMDTSASPRDEAESTWSGEIRPIALAFSSNLTWTPLIHGTVNRCIGRTV